MKRPNFYAASPLDWAGHLRKDEAWLAARRHHDASRYLIVWNGKSLLRQQDEGPRAFFVSSDAVGTFLEAKTANSIFLGLDGETSYFTLDIAGEAPPLSALGLADRDDIIFSDLRLIGATLPAGEAAMLAHGRGLAYWHSRHLFCGICGNPTLAAQGGHIRVCTKPDCATHHFPRTDPAVIMLIRDGDRCLLGRQASWPEGMFSTLAGFVEPGESLEEAVAREVFEEVGVRVSQVTYHSSQPWPFPASIMLGFYAVADTARIVLDSSEIDDARWLTRAQVRLQDGFRLPPPSSIARRMIEDWVAGNDEG